MAKLTGAQLAVLHSHIVSAFTKDELTKLVRYKMTLDLDAEHNMDAPKRDCFFEFVASMERVGRTGEFINAVLAAVPYREDVQAELRRLLHICGQSRVMVPRQLPPRASVFVGRESQIAELEARLERGGRVEVWAGAGMGKTALAAEVVAKLVGEDVHALTASIFPQGVVLLDLHQLRASDSPDLAWSALADAFDATLTTDMTAEKRARLACAARRALVVLEGAETLGTGLDAFLDVLSAETTRLILTRDEAQTTRENRIKLHETLNDDEALRLLRHLAGEEVAEGTLKAVHQEFGGHPLVLDWVGRRLNDADEPPQELLRDIRAQPFTTITQPGSADHTLRWVFERGLVGMHTTTRQVLIAAAHVSAPFGVSLARAAGGDKSDLRRLVQCAFFRVSEDGWHFSHALSALYARDLERPPGMLEKLGDWALEELRAADAACSTDPSHKSVGTALDHVIALLEHDGSERVLRTLVDELLYSNDSRLPFGMRIGRLDFSSRSLEAVLKWQQRASSEEQASGRWSMDASTALEKLGDVAGRRGNFPVAKQVYKSSFDLRLNLVEAEPANPVWLSALSVSLSKLGDLARSDGDATTARSHYTDSLTIRRMLANADPSLGEWQWLLYTILQRLGLLAVECAEREEAVRFLTESYDICSGLSRAEPQNVEFLHGQAAALSNLGRLAYDSEDYSAAMRYFNEDKLIMQRLVQLDAANCDYKLDLSSSLHNIGTAAADQGEFSLALPSYQESLSIRSLLVQSDPLNAVWLQSYWSTHWGIASLLVKMGEEESASAQYQLVHQIMQEMKGRGLHFSAEDEKKYQMLETAIQKEP